MDRRSVLRSATVAGLVATAGCIDLPGQSDVNETLEVRNEESEPVTLEITIEQRRLLTDETSIVFDRQVEVAAEATRSLDVLGPYQYYLTVRKGAATHEFGTRPICDRAFTGIVVTEAGELESSVRDCE